MNTFQDKVIWITGASSGIGEALAYAFADEGAKLILSSRRSEELLRVKSRCGKAASVEILVFDVSRSEEHARHVVLAAGIFGRIDMLVHCAGVSQRSVASETSEEVYREIMETDFFGPALLTRLVLNNFLEQNTGHFVVVSSLAGKVGLPQRTGYCAAKHALEGFFSSLRTEIWKSNIPILIVRPGAVKTNIAVNALRGDGAKFNAKDKIIDNGIAPATVATSIIKAIRKNRRELVICSAKERVLLTINRFAPGMVFNIVKNITP